MKLHIERGSTNCIDIVDGLGSTVASIVNDLGDITDVQEKIAGLICKSFNSSPESEGILEFNDDEN